LKETKRGLADETANVIELQRKVTQSSQDALDVRLRSESLRNELKAQIQALQLKFAVRSSLSISLSLSPFLSLALACSLFPLSLSLSLSFSLSLSLSLSVFRYAVAV